MGELTIRLKSPRLFALAVNLEALVEDYMSIVEGDSLGN